MIRSRIAMQEGPVAYAGALLANNGDCTYRVVVTVGNEKGLSAAGTACMKIFVRPTSKDTIVIVELRVPERVASRVKAALRGPSAGVIIMFLCATPAIWDSCIKELNVEPFRVDSPLGSA